MTARVIVGDALAMLGTLDAESVQCCVTSPPYFGLRDYGMDGQIGAETSPEEYVARLVAVFGEVRRVLREDGTLWLNLGDSYANDSKWGGSTCGKHAKGVHGETGVGRGKRSTGLKAKELIGIPWMVALALRADGGYLRCDIIWHKPSVMPTSVTDRPTRDHEYLFLLTRQPHYFYDADAIREPHKPDSLVRYEYGLNSRSPADGFVSAGAANPRSICHSERMGDNVNPLGRNARSVWTIANVPFPEAHFATFPEELPRRCILAGSRVDDTVLDPFCGAGTTGLVADSNQRSFIGIELNPEYAALAERRIYRDGAPLFSVGR